MKTAFGKIVFGLSALGMANLAWAAPQAQSPEPVELLVSIDVTISEDEIEAAVEDLNRKDPTTGLCYVESEVNSYIPYDFAPDALYYGVAIVGVETGCDEDLQKFVKELQDDERYTVWSNPRIVPAPSVSVSN